jgi:hypothetical protein
VHEPLNLADEVEDDSLLRNAEDLRIEILGVIRAEHVIAFAICIIVGIVDNFDQTIVAHAAREAWLNDLGVLALPDFAGDSGDRLGVGHLNIIIIELIKIMLQEQSAAKIVFNVSRAPPCISLRCLDADMWGISERRIETVQVPVRVTEVALQHLALTATRCTTLRAQDGLLLTIKHSCVVWSLVAVAAVFGSVSRQC